jgi:hypothetical protein
MGKSTSMFPPGMSEAASGGQISSGQRDKAALMGDIPAGFTDLGVAPGAMAPRGMEGKETIGLDSTLAEGMPRKVMKKSGPASARVFTRGAAPMERAQISATALAGGFSGWGSIPPTYAGIWDWKDNIWVGSDVRTRGLELVCAADGSGVVRFKMIQQSLASEGGTGCERDDCWFWDNSGGSCAIDGQSLQFNVSGRYSLAYPNWISGTCNPSLDTSNPIADLIVFPSSQVVGTTMDIVVPAAWGPGTAFNLPNLALSWSGAVPAWSPWDTIGGYCIDGVAVSSWGPERLDVFVIAGAGETWHKAWLGTAWTDWESLGGTCISAPAAVSWGPNRVDVFVISGDHALYHQWWDGSTWSGWAENLGGYCLYGVAAISRGPNVLDVFVIGGDGAVWHRAFDGSTWSGWDRVGGFCTSAPAASSPSGSNWVDLYVISADHAVYHNAWYDGAWHGFSSLGGYAIYGVAATTWPDVYTIGGDSQMYRNVWTGSAWSGWVSLGGACLSAPAAVSWGSGHLDAFVIGPGNACWHKWYG